MRGVQYRNYTCNKTTFLLIIKSPLVPRYPRIECIIDIRDHILEESYGIGIHI